jgi:hypothetical protein
MPDDAKVLDLPLPPFDFRESVRELVRLPDNHSVPRGAPPPVDRVRLADLIPGREYLVRWRHLRRRQRVRIEGVYREGELVAIEYRPAINEDGRTILGRPRWLRAIDLADFEPVVRLVEAGEAP